jgi:hypothetical protein
MENLLWGAVQGAWYSHLARYEQHRDSQSVWGDVACTPSSYKNSPVPPLPRRALYHSSFPGM